jgi:hypothetical protein
MYRALKTYCFIVILLQACSSKETESHERGISSPEYFIFEESIDVIKAGEVYSLVLNRPSEALIVNSWGNYFIKTTELNGTHTLFLPDSLTRQAGLNKIKFLADGFFSKEKTLLIEPNKVSEPLESYIGSKSIEADGGKSWAMITAIPQDSFFNLAPTGTKVVFNYAKPDGSFYHKTSKTAFGVAFDRINSGYKIGKTKIGVNSEGISGKEKELIEIAGAPVDFRIETQIVYPTADSRQNFTLQTGILKDKFGNIVANGTLVNFYVEDVEGDQRKVSAYTFDGRAKVDLRNPNLEGKIAIQAEVGNTAMSNKLSLNFKRFIKDLPVSCDSSKVMIGPLVGALNQYVSDGSEVEITILPENFNRVMPVKDGYAFLYFEDITKGDKEFIIKFGGISTSITCSPNE